MPDPAMENDAWVRSAQFCEEPIFDVFVQLADSVYVGPQNGLTLAQWQDERVPVKVPDLPCRLPDRVSTADLLGQEMTLAAHYTALARILTTHKQEAELRRPFPYFTLRPTLLCGDRIVADWPWSDSLPDAVTTLKQLVQAPRTAPGAMLLDDQEQGWRLLIMAGSGVLNLVEWDAEGPPPLGQGWRIPTSALARQAAAALARLHTVHAALCQHLGHDPWS